MEQTFLIALAASMLFSASGCKKNDNCPDHQMRKKHKDDMCTMIYAPICGCDGKTYGNECEARRNGITVVREGEC